MCVASVSSLRKWHNLDFKGLTYDLRADVRGGPEVTELFALYARACASGVGWWEEGATCSSLSMMLRRTSG